MISILVFFLLLNSGKLYNGPGNTGLTLLVLIGGAALSLAVSFLGVSLSVRSRLRAPDASKGPSILGTLGLAYLLPLLALGFPALLGALIYGLAADVSFHEIAGWFYSLFSPIDGGWNSWFAILNALCLGWIAVWSILRPGALSLDLIRPSKAGFWPCLAGVLAGLGLWLAAFFLQRIFLDLAAPGVNSWPDNAGNAIVAMAVAVSVAPFAEEVFFRGYVLSKWKARWGLPLAVVLSSALFAALHFNLLAFPGLLVVGACLAGLTLWTESLLPAILAHVVFNLLMVVR